ncbi:hypothetical protein M427DRAFT_130789 [Gonapodya prolifera JEL478]|uniref:Uncharacterized protein n=1 Tax=Gonapodya prolifera (strain JEL478) TaxID=1344416 RepID=A0A139AXT9_GONPJ|nr:hypothetical protein M427DRAFT_130789 [Gonapodya prolifera JEL478]|eukprot:KXS21265.1 hypothetical protein M427DRAFT_130789 [Gonapodya prolifera JEL478]
MPAQCALAVEEVCPQDVYRCDCAECGGGPREAEEIARVEACHEMQQNFARQHEKRRRARFT